MAAAASRQLWTTVADARRRRRGTVHVGQRARMMMVTMMSTSMIVLIGVTTMVMMMMSMHVAITTGNVRSMTSMSSNNNGHRLTALPNTGAGHQTRASRSQAGRGDHRSGHQLWRGGRVRRRQHRIRCRPTTLDSSPTCRRFVRVVTITQVVHRRLPCHCFGPRTWALLLLLLTWFDNDRCRRATLCA